MTVEILGKPTCTVAWRYPGEEAIQKGQLVKAGVDGQLQDQFRFKEVIVPENIEEEVLIFKGGRSEIGGRSVSIDELRIGDAGLQVESVETTETQEAFLEEVVSYLDSLELFPALTTREKVSQYRTEVRVRLSLNPVDLLDDAFLEFLREAQPSFTQKGFRSEINLVGLTTIFSNTPNPDLLRDKSMTLAEMSELLRMARAFPFAFQVDSPADYQRRVFTVVADQPFESLIKLLQDLTERFPQD